MWRVPHLLEITLGVEGGATVWGSNSSIIVSIQMRILHISSSRTFGGGERHVADLTRGLADRGHEVFVALRPTNEWQHRLNFLSPENIMHVSIRNSFGVLSSMRIADFVRQNKIDIVHAHVARDYIPASIAASMHNASRHSFRSLPRLMSAFVRSSSSRPAAVFTASS